MLLPRGGLEDLIGISIRLQEFRLIEQPQGFFRLTLCSPYGAPGSVRENSIRKCRSLIEKIEEAKGICRKNQKCSSNLVKQKARGACIFSLPRVRLTRRAPCIYPTAAFENRTIGKTLDTHLSLRLCNGFSKSAKALILICQSLLCDVDFLCRRSLHNTHRFRCVEPEFVETCLILLIRNVYPARKFVEVNFSISYAPRSSKHPRCDSDTVKLSAVIGIFEDRGAEFKFPATIPRQKHLFQSSLLRRQQFETGERFVCCDGRAPEYTQNK